VLAAGSKAGGTPPATSVRGAVALES